jgi:hypothetical protein
MKLFAVAVLASASSAQAETTFASYVDKTIKPRQLANGRAAPGNTGGGKTKGGGDKESMLTDDEPVVAKRMGVDWNGKIEVTAIKPRVLADGRPAAGNSVGKPLPSQVREDIDQKREALLTASLAYQAVNSEPVIQPRLLANFRPACGNTGGKSDAPADCSTAEIRAVDAYNKASADAYSKHSAKVQVAYNKLMVATAAAVHADPTLAARLLINGRPACGNTMSKKGPPAFCREAKQ